MNLSKYLCLLLIYCSSITSAYHTIVAPVSIQSNWTRITPDHLFCPFASSIPTNSENFIEIQGDIQLESYHQQEEIPGFFCVKQVWIKKCSEGFFGQKTLETVIVTSQINDVECNAALKSYIKGSHVYPHEPEAVCGWMQNDIENSLLFIDIIPHGVINDYYTGLFFDNVFPQGKCANSPCQTIYPNILWMPTYSKVKSCQFNFKDLGLFKFDAISRKPVSVQSELLPHDTLAKICQLHYCGIDGVLTDSNFFFKIHDEHIKGLLSNSPPCQIGREVIIPSSVLFSLQISINENHNIHTRYCLSVKERIINDGKVSSYSLSAFASPEPGLYPCYRIRNKSLEMSMCNYHRILVDQAKPEIYGFNYQTREVISNPDKSCLGNNCDLFNGIKLKEGKFSHPNYEIGRQNIALEDLLVQSLTNTVKYVNTTHSLIHTDYLQIGGKNIQGKTVSEVLSLTGNSLFNKSIKFSICALLLLLIPVMIYFAAKRFCSKVVYFQPNNPQLSYRYQIRRPFSR